MEIVTNAQSFLSVEKHYHRCAIFRRWKKDSNVQVVFYIGKSYVYALSSEDKKKISAGYLLKIAISDIFHT